MRCYYSTIIPGPSRRKRTITKVNKQPVYLPKRRVMMTDIVKDDCPAKGDAPIVVTPFKGKYYIQDGNHRFAKTKGGGILAYVLYEGDQGKIEKRGVLPKHLREWIKGKISYDELRNLAVTEAENI